MKKRLCSLASVLFLILSQLGGTLYADEIAAQSESLITSDEIPAGDSLDEIDPDYTEECLPASDSEETEFFEETDSGDIIIAESDAPEDFEVIPDGIVTETEPAETIPAETEPEEFTVVSEDFEETCLKR